MQPVGATFMRGWIKPSESLDPDTLAPLVARFREVPRITQAWLVGTRMTPNGGCPSIESTDIALILDPSLTQGAETDRTTMVELITDLDEVYPMTTGRRGWLFVTNTIMEAHRAQAILLYSRCP